MNCKVCGNPISDDARFCPECGALNESENEIADIAEGASSEPLIENLNENKTDFEIESDSDNLSEQIPDSIEEKTETISEQAVSQESLSENTEESSDLENKKEICFSTSEKDEKKDISDSDISKPEPKEIVFTSEEKPVNPIIQTDTASDTSNNEEMTPIEKQTAPVKLKAGRAFGATIISVFTVLFLTILGIVFSMRIGFSSEIVEKRVSSMSVETLLDTDCDGKYKTFEYIYNNISGAIPRGETTEPKDLRSFLVRADFLKFISQNAEAFSAYIIEGSSDKNPSVSSADVVDFFKQNEELADEELGYVMNEAGYMQLEKELNERGFDDALSTEKWSDELGFNVRNIRFVFSLITIAIIFALVLVMFIWIAIVIDKNRKHLTSFYGNILVISGILLFVPSLVFLIVSTPTALRMGTLVSYACAEILFPVAVIALCTGVFEIIIGAIFKKIQKSIRKKMKSKEGK